MTTWNAVNWFVAQDSASLTNVLSRTYLAEILADPVNAETIIEQRVRLPQVTVIEINAFRTVTTEFDDILSRLRIGWANVLELYYLGQIVAGLSILPYSLDFSTLSDGALPSEFSGATFAIASGLLTNSPSVGAELLTNPTLSGTYVAGLAPNLTKNGSPTVAESADSHPPAGQAQEFTAAAFNNRLNFPLIAAVNGAWYIYSGWVKRTAGTGTDTRIRLDQAAMRPWNGSAGAAVNVASYTQKKVGFITGSTANMTPFTVIEAGSSAFDTVIVDDFSLKRLTYGDLFALLEETQANVIVKAMPNTLADQTLSAVVARADAQTSPTSGLFAFYHWRDPEDFIVVSLFELSGGTYTQKIAETSITPVANAWLEIRVTGTTAQLFYNNIQRGTDQTVAVTGTHHGMVVTGGNSIKNFSVASN